MKSNDSLNSLLKTWNPAPKVPFTFQAGVWARIAAVEGQAAIPRIGSGWRAPLMAAVAMAIIGIFLAHLVEAKSGPTGRDAYFTRINPLAQTR